MADVIAQFCRPWIEKDFGVIQIAFFYLMKRTPDRIMELVPEHIEYWRNKNLRKYTGGPFSDKTGGLILFQAPSLTHALNIIEADPFVAEGLVSEKWVKEWMPEK